MYNAYLLHSSFLLPSNNPDYFNVSCIETSFKEVKNLLFKLMLGGLIGFISIEQDCNSSSVNWSTFNKIVLSGIRLSFDILLTKELIALLFNQLI